MQKRIKNSASSGDADIALVGVDDETVCIGLSSRFTTTLEDGRFIGFPITAEEARELAKALKKAARKVEGQ